jgi:hypothetical protein
VTRRGAGHDHPPSGGQSGRSGAGFGAASGAPGGEVRCDVQTRFECAGTGRQGLDSGECSHSHGDAARAIHAI